MKSMVAAIAAVSLGAFVGAAAADEGRGGLTLDPRQSVESMTLGGTGLTRIGGAEGFGANPASLPRMRALGIAVAHHGLIEGIPSSATSVWVAMPIGKRLAYPGAEPSGSLLGIGLSFDHMGLDLAQGSSWASQTLSLGLGYSASTYASTGVLIKYLFSSSDVAGTEVTGFGIDLGGRVELRPGVDAGVAVRNILATTSWDGGQDETPPVIISVGATLASPFGTTTQMAVTLAGDNGNKIGIGLEVPLMTTGFLLRGGYQHNSDDDSRNAVSAGIGFRHLRFMIAYAFRIENETAFGTTHHFSLSTDFR